MTKITPPASQIPVGTVTINGQRLEVQQHPEFVRFFFDLFRRVGSTEALSNTDLEALTQALIDAGPQPGSSPEAQEALRAVDELRNELAAVRGQGDELRARLDELAGLIEPAPNLRPLLERVETIEGRLQ